VGKLGYHFLIPCGCCELSIARLAVGSRGIFFPNLNGVSEGLYLRLPFLDSPDDVYAFLVVLFRTIGPAKRVELTRIKNFSGVIVGIRFDDHHLPMKKA
jgi:hypothetical protein